MDVISAIDRYTKKKPQTTTTYPQMTPAVPPFVRTELMVVRSTSQVAMSVHPNPNIDMN